MLGAPASGSFPSLPQGLFLMTATSSSTFRLVVDLDIPTSIDIAPSISLEDEPPSAGQRAHGASRPPSWGAASPRALVTGPRTRARTSSRVAVGLWCTCLLPSQPHRRTTGHDPEAWLSARTPPLPSRTPSPTRSGLGLRGRMKAATASSPSSSLVILPRVPSRPTRHGPIISDKVDPRQKTSSTAASFPLSRPLCKCGLPCESPATVRRCTESGESFEHA